MKKFNYVITDEIGLHARPAGALAKEAAKFSSQIRIACRDKEADAKRLIAMMGLGIKKDDEVTVSAAGADEETACEAMMDFFTANL